VKPTGKLTNCARTVIPHLGDGDVSNDPTGARRVGMREGITQVGEARPRGEWFNQRCERGAEVVNRSPRTAHPRTISLSHRRPSS
jgi:hypothetical protein